jgi:GlcNAc-PI de-N-acetylase
MMPGDRGCGPADTARTVVTGPAQELPGWRQVLAVVAHPDDETFGLGAIAGQFAKDGASVHVLCFTHGEASTLNENDAELHEERARNSGWLPASLSWPVQPFATQAGFFLLSKGVARIRLGVRSSTP